MSRRRRASRLARGTVALVVAPHLVAALAAGGCAATAAVVAVAIIAKMLTPHGYKLTIKAEQRPRDLYNGLVRILKRDHPDIRIAEENQPERYFEARWLAQEAGSGPIEEWVSFVVQPLPDETSELVIAMGQGTDRHADYRQWALGRLDAMLTELDVEWSVASAWPDGSAARLAAARAP